MRVYINVYGYSHLHIQTSFEEETNLDFQVLLEVP